MADIPAARTKSFLCSGGRFFWCAVAALVIGAAGTKVAGFIWSALVPSDRSVLEGFQRNKPVYEQLYAMLAEDAKIESLGKHGIRTNRSVLYVSAAEAGFSEERYRQYMDLLKRAKIIRINRDGDKLYFMIAGWGFASHGWRLGIVRRESPPAKAVSRLSDFGSENTLPVGGTTWREIYRPIEGPWYIWLIW